MNQPHIPESISCATGRRRFLGGIGVSSLAALLPAEAARASTQATAPVKTSARIVIAGGGAAGLTAANKLATQLTGATIIMVDRRKEHYYQPGFTLVAAGIKPQDYTVSQTSSYVPNGVEWLNEAVVELDPVGNKVVTDSGKRLAYDFLIVATGLELNYGAIEGMDAALIGQNGLGSIYHGPQAAADTWKALSTFADQGGIGLFGRPSGEMKCAGAPLKYTFISDDHLRRRGNRGKAELIYMAHAKSLFSVPIVAEKVRMLYQDRGVKVRHEHVLQSIDLGRKVPATRPPTVWSSRTTISSTWCRRCERRRWCATAPCLGPRVSGRPMAGWRWTAARCVTSASPMYLASVTSRACPRARPLPA